ncbi:hypothetical protein [Anaerorhabdus sp.]|uniref:hypothetical protein n=1 Tax=Anaerorhabdus sp. TaxID=1872524 RepID=UPI002FC901A5
MQNRVIKKATCYKKQAYDYFPIPGDLPFPNQEYDVQFKTDTDEIIDCTCSIFEYQVLEEGDEGELVLNGHQIIRFADKIKEITE